MPPIPDELLPYVPLAAPFVASLALLVSVFALATSKASYRLARDTYDRAGPRVKIRHYVVSDFPDEASGKEVPYLMIQIYNTGLAPVSVENLYMRARGAHLYLDIDTELARQRKGPQRPFMLKPGTSTLWQFAIHGVRYQQYYIIDQDEMRRRLKVCTIRASLGNGTSARNTKVDFGLIERFDVWLNPRMKRVEKSLERKANEE